MHARPQPARRRHAAGASAGATVDDRVGCVIRRQLPMLRCTGRCHPRRVCSGRRRTGPLMPLGKLGDRGAAGRSALAGRPRTVHARRR
eukprot:scaffold13448_cov109-Isochrysis_galbana.AAC.2